MQWTIGHSHTSPIEPRVIAATTTFLTASTRDWDCSLRYVWDTVTSVAYWKFVLFSWHGLRSILFVYGSIYLIVESLDFFDVYARDRYASYAFLLFLALSALLSAVIQRPTKSVIVTFPKKDFSIEVRIGDLFDAAGAIMISSNTVFEAKIAAGKLSPASLQGQFVSR